MLYIFFFHTITFPFFQLKQVNLASLRTCVVIAEERPRITLIQTFNALFSSLGLSPKAVSTSFGSRVNIAICMQVMIFFPLPRISFFFSPLNNLEANSQTECCLANALVQDIKKCEFYFLKYFFFFFI